MRTAFVASLSMLAFVLICAAAAAAPRDVALGQAIYERECGNCHQIGPGAMSLSTGPALNGIIGMPAADEPDFSYSDANEKCGIIWTAARFDTFIANPKGAMPGTAMVYGGLKLKADREALLAYVSGFDVRGAMR